jgi:hypothetical protein
MMDSQPLELDLWQSLQTATQFPETADLRSLCEALEHSLLEQPVTAQLQVAGEALVQLSQVYAARANQIFTHWEQQHSPTEPVVDLEECTDLFVQSLSLDVSDLFEQPEPVQYPAHRKSIQSPVGEDLMVAEVGKDALLQWIDQQIPASVLDEAQMAEQIHRLAHGENVADWSRAIAHYLEKIHSSARLIELQQALEMPLIEIWLGLLLGNFCLKQEGTFYSTQDAWVIYDASNQSPHW